MGQASWSDPVWLSDVKIQDTCVCDTNNLSMLFNFCTVVSCVST